MKLKSKIVQVSTATTENKSGDVFIVVTVLCEDGSVWCKSGALQDLANDRWEKIS